MHYLKPDGFEGRPVFAELARGDQVDPFYIALTGMAAAIHDARNAAAFTAESYRQFDVGGVAFAWDNDRKVLDKITSSNYKVRLNPHELDDLDLEEVPKVCAEMVLFGALDTPRIDLDTLSGETEGPQKPTAEYIQYARALGIVVAGTADLERIKKVTFKETATLHMCPECRAHACASPHIDANTQFHTIGTDGTRTSKANNTNDNYQSQRLQAIQHMYNPYRKTAFKDAEHGRFIAREWGSHDNPGIRPLYYKFVVEAAVRRGDIAAPEDRHDDISRDRFRQRVYREASKASFSIPRTLREQILATAA